MIEILTYLDKELNVIRIALSGKLPTSTVRRAEP